MNWNVGSSNRKLRIQNRETAVPFLLLNSQFAIRTLLFNPFEMPELSFSTMPSLRKQPFAHPPIRVRLLPRVVPDAGVFGVTDIAGAFLHEGVVHVPRLFDRDDGVIRPVED